MAKRSFIKSTALTAMLPSMCISSCKKDIAFPIIDTHVHLWDLAPIINHCLDQFGPDRVVFAGDWPVVLWNMPLANWIQTLKEVVAMRPMEEHRKLFHDNAEAFYGLS